MPEGTGAYGGQSAYSRQEALEPFRRSAAASRRPFVYLGAGVNDDGDAVLPADADTPFSDVLCGRVNWQDGIPCTQPKGAKALEAGLEDCGVANIEALDRVVHKGAQSWWTLYGGKKNIEVVG